MDVVDGRDERARLAARQRPRMTARTERAEVRNGVREEQVARLDAPLEPVSDRRDVCGSPAWARKMKCVRGSRADAGVTAATSATAAAAASGTAPRAGRHPAIRIVPAPTSAAHNGRLSIRWRALRNAVLVSRTRATSESSGGKRNAAAPTTASGVDLCTRTQAPTSASARKSQNAMLPPPAKPRAADAICVPALPPDPSAVPLDADTSNLRRAEALRLRAAPSRLRR